MKKVISLLFLCALLEACSNSMLYNNEQASPPEYKEIIKINNIPIIFEAYSTGGDNKSGGYTLYAYIHKDNHAEYKKSKISHSKLNEGFNILYEKTCKKEGEVSRISPITDINNMCISRLGLTVVLF